MSNHLYSSLLERAFRVSAHFHRDQTRKGTNLPYLVHPASVMLILQRAGITDEEILAAALLHDVVEDTDCTLENLALEFPPSVVEWVSQTSEQKADDAGVNHPWIDRKREHLAHTTHADWQARAVILADKMHNLMSVLYDLEQGEPVWDRFNASPSAFLWYNAAMIEAAAHDNRPELEQLAAAGRSVVAKLTELTGFEPAEPSGA